MRNGKRIVYSILVLCMTICMMYNSITHAYADSSSTLGTPEALGSPILNSNFSSESWDKWEMIVYGIYLSNFCVPLVDSYESALTSNSSYGSKGSGIAALNIGSGEDAREIIETLTSQAISFQSQSSASTIYVSYTSLQNGKINEKSDPNGGATVRAARFSDLFMLVAPPDSGEEKTWATDASIVDAMQANINIISPGVTLLTNGVMSESTLFGNTYSMNVVTNANLPTFYVKNGDKYIEIFDYTNAWDVQLMACMVNTAITSGYKDDFYNNYNKLYGSNTLGDDGAQIGFDAFGNIVSNVDGRNIVIIPASVNQHLTNAKQINLLNSLIVNGSLRNVTTDIVKTGKQALDLSEHFANIGNIYGFLSNCNYSGGGTSAFNSKDTTWTQKGGEQAQGATILFKDSDSMYIRSGNNNTLETMVKYGSFSDNTLPLKIEVVSEESIKCSGDNVGNGALSNTVSLCTTLCNQTDITQSFGMTSILMPSGSEAELFTESVLVANQSKVDRDNKSNASINRQLINFMYTIYKEGTIDTSAGKIDKNTIESSISVIDTRDKLREVLNSVWTYYRAYNKELTDANYDADTIVSALFDYVGNRFTVVQVPSQELCEASKLFNRESGDFSTYAAFIYVTYLRFYGINSSSILGEAGGNTTSLNTELFYNSSAKDFSVDGMSGIVSQEQKKEEVLNMSYLMLSPTEEGKEYRNEITKSNLTSFINNQYEAIVSGTSSGSSTNLGKAGFLTIQSLEENPFTSFIIEKYADIVIVALTITLIIIVIAGLILNKKFEWYFITIIIYVNAILLLPSVGNISSTVSNKLNNSLFSNKMTFWSISQQIEDKNTVDKIKDTDGDYGLLSEIVDSIASTSTDRTLMVKKDISSKLTTNVDESYKDAIQLTSARWILPIVMQQMSAEGENDENNYVYVNMINMMDDASNVYMFWNDNYKESIGTVSSETESNNSNENISVPDRINKYYNDYYDTSNTISYNGISYRHDGYYNSQYKDMSHTYFYLLEASGSVNTPLCISSEGIISHSDIDSYQNYIDIAATSNIGAWEATAEHLQNVSDEYVRNDLSSIDSSYGYLLNTESVYNYMYQTVEDTFSSTETTGSLIGKIQGQYRDNSNGEQVRDNFMYAKSDSELYTGDIKDILDLQELFTNNIQYTYKMWLSAGGFDGNTGVLGDSKIEGHTYYDGNNKSWMFRSNWAIKMMENSDLNSGCTVRDKDGNKYEIENMMIPQCYPSDRPMIFSRAQQNAYGLDESDLSYVELKCIKVNEDVAKNWTSLLNFAGTSSITKEIILRQMAMDATNTFNKEFTTNTIMSYKYALVPQSIDLRSLSFDSIMKMIILNITNDASYVYGNTAESLISKVDIITSAILLITAMLCTYIIPLIRNIMATVILILSMYAIIHAITSDNRFKARIMLGSLLTQVEIIIVNAVYYSVFSLFIRATGNDDVLSVERINSHIVSGNPVWALIMIMGISIVYITVMCRMIWNFIQNRNDMGFEKYFAIMSSISGKASGRMERALNGIGGIFGYENNTVQYNEYGGSINDSKEEKETKVKITQKSNETVKVANKEESDSVNNDKDVEVSIYDDSIEVEVTRERDRIDEEIDKMN